MASRRDGRRGIGAQGVGAGAGAIGIGRWWWSRGWWSGGGGGGTVEGAEAVAVLVELETRSHEGHMVRVVGGVMCM